VISSLPASHRLYSVKKILALADQARLAFSDDT